MKSTRLIYLLGLYPALFADTFAYLPDGIHPQFFFREATGAFNSAGLTEVNNAEAYGINNSGWVVGAYFKGVTTHGFLRDPRGAFVTVDFPEVSATVPFAINANG